MFQPGAAVGPGHRARSLRRLASQSRVHETRKHLSDLGLFKTGDGFGWGSSYQSGDPTHLQAVDPEATTPSFDIRLATPEDSLLVAAQRVAMFRDMGRTTPQIEQPLLESCAGYLVKALASGEYVGWVAQLTAPPHSVIGGAGVQFRPFIPRTDPSGQLLLAGREGLILNVYVDPAHRRQGVARRLMDTLIHWAPGVGIVRLVLHASPAGRRLYESLGFFASNEMFFPPFGTPSASRDGSG